LHPEIRFEEDVIELLRFNDELRQVLLEDPEASRCDMGIGYSPNWSPCENCTKGGSLKKLIENCSNAQKKESCCDRRSIIA
jgi:hypothetical protein